LARDVFLETNYWELYPGREEVYLKDIRRVDKGVGVLLEFGSCIKGFSHFLFSLDDGQYERSCGSVLVRFHRSDGKPRCMTLRIKAVSEKGVESRVYNVKICHYPKEYYGSKGRTAPGYVIVQTSDVSVSRSRVEDWITQSPTEEERKYAWETWGRLTVDAETDYSAAKAVAKAIIDALEPHRGVPSDVMDRLSPFEQYRRAVAGKDKVWCGNIAAIFSYACNALGIPCRLINMGNVVSRGDGGYWVLLAEGHLTTEIFSENLGQWIWIDPTMRILGAYMSGNLVNLAEFHYFLNDHRWRRSLEIIRYNPATRSEMRVSLSESIPKGIANYFKKDQCFKYIKV